MGHRPVGAHGRSRLDTGCAPTEAFDDTAGLREDVCSRWTAAVEAAALHPGRVAGAIKAIAAAGAPGASGPMLRKWTCCAGGHRDCARGPDTVDAAHC